MRNYKIAVAGTGYVGLSIATLLSQHHKVTAVDIIPEKVDMINNRKSPIQDDYIEKYLAEKELNLTATLDAKAAYSDASRCNNFHGNVAARMNSINANKDTFKMYTDMFLTEYIILAIHLNSQGALSDMVLNKVKENANLMV